MKTAEYLIDDYAHTSIPELPGLEGWKGVSVHDNGEDLVRLDHAGIPDASFYAGLHDFSPYYLQPGALSHVYVRNNLADLLHDVQRKLPQNMSLLALDGYRPLGLQKSLYDNYYRKLARLQPTWTDQELSRETQRYVSIPSYDLNKPSPHNTGGAIDLWILELPDGSNRNDFADEGLLQIAHWLPAGAPFDHGGEKAGLRYYEDNDVRHSEIFRRNRRIVFWLMREVGLEPYADEYWHYNHGNQMAAKSSGKRCADYGAVALSLGQQFEEASCDQHRISFPSRKIYTNLPVGEIITPSIS